jgi:hypothetical protein
VILSGAPEPTRSVMKSIALGRTPAAEYALGQTPYSGHVNEPATLPRADPNLRW